MNSICSSGGGGACPKSGFTGSPILCHSSLRPLWVATDGTAGGLVKPRTLMGAVGRREAWPRGLPTPTPTSSYIATPVAFLRAPRLTHDWEHPRPIFQRGAELEAGALSAKAVTALEAAPARPIGRFVFSLCVLTVAPLKNNWTFLCTAPRP